MTLRPPLFPVITPPWNHTFITRRVGGFVFAIRSCISFSHAHTCLQFLSECSSAVSSLRCTLLVINNSSSVCCWHHLAHSFQSSNSCFLCMCESLYTTQELLNASNCSCNNLGVKDMSWIIPICRCKLLPPTLRKPRVASGEKEVVSCWRNWSSQVRKPVSYWFGEEHVKMANVVWVVKINSLPITDLQLNCTLAFEFHISVLLLLPWVCLVASLNPGKCLISGAPSVKEFHILTEKPLFMLEPDIFVWSLIVLLSGGDLLIVDSLELRRFQHLMICLL